jgi:hypothetical protein
MSTTTKTTSSSEGPQRAGRRNDHLDDRAGVEDLSHPAQLVEQRAKSRQRQLGTGALPGRRPGPAHQRRNAARERRVRVEGMKLAPAVGGHVHGPYLPIVRGGGDGVLASIPRGQTGERPRGAEGGVASPRQVGARLLDA